MGKLLKPGRVVVVLGGRHAGKKAIVLSATDSGTKERKFGHCLLLGVSQPAKKVTKSMSKRKIERRVRVKPFIKHMNYNHVIPTRYHVSSEILDPKIILQQVKVEEKQDVNARAQNKEAKKAMEDLLTEKFLNPTVKGKPNKDTLFLRKKLRF